MSHNWKSKRWDRLSSTYGQWLDEPSWTLDLSISCFILSIGFIFKLLVGQLNDTVTHADSNSLWILLKKRFQRYPQHAFSHCSELCHIAGYWPITDRRDEIIIAGLEKSWWMHIGTSIALSTMEGLFIKSGIENCGEGSGFKNIKAILSSYAVQKLVLGPKLVLGHMSPSQTNPCGPSRGCHSCQAWVR